MRAALAAVLLLALLALSGWWAWATGTGRIGNVRVLDRPDGDEVVLSLLAVRSIDGDDRYVVGSSTLTVPVRGPTEGLAVGQELTVGGVVRDGFVEARWREVATGRGAKKQLGFVGLLLAGVVAAGTLRVERSGLALRG